MLLSWPKCCIPQEHGMVMCAPLQFCQTSRYDLWLSLILSSCIVRLLGKSPCLWCYLLKSNRALLRDSFVPGPLTATNMLRLRSPVDPEDNFIVRLHDDIQMEMFQLLDFADLVNISHTCMNFRKQIKWYVKKRIMAGLAPYFGSYTDELLTLLQFGAGCVSGHVITAVYDLQLCVCDFPKDMKIYVPRRGWRVLVVFLRDVLHLGPPLIVALDETARDLAFASYRWDLPVRVC